ncbi:hypothetical protein [Floridanema aerugineum]|uniref:Uncharacterized protein n=1 Tax=Floridaenema aerugineum BLCC-F46 TaxID=3153654 RepID=A0ABV4WYG6_9CYAN
MLTRRESHLAVVEARSVLLGKLTISTRCGVECGLNNCLKTIAIVRMYIRCILLNILCGIEGAIVILGKFRAARKELFSQELMRQML